MQRIIAVALLAVCVATSAAAFDEWWDYRDWTAFIERVQGGRVTECTARAGPDGGPFLTVSTTDVDTKPPALYPSIDYEEPGIRGIPTQLRDGDRITFVLDTGEALELVGASYLTSEGIPRASAGVEYADRQPLLKAMRNGSQLDVMRGGERLARVSLAGFTAAYGKIAEQCSFPTVGVID